MLKRKNWFVLIALILAVSMVLAACSGSGSQDNANNAGENTEEIVELNFVNWATAEEATKARVNKVIEAFEGENPHIKIKNITIPFSEIQNQLTVMTTAGNAPDIAQVASDVGISLAAMGALVGTDELLSQDFLSDVNKSYYEIGLYQDKHYLVPWGGGTNGFWYNKKIMEQAGLDPHNPPRTMEELNAAMAKVKTLPDVVPLQFDTTARPFTTGFQWPFMKSFGEEPFNRESVQVSKMTAYSEWLRNLVGNGYTLPGKKLGEFRPLGAQDRLAFAFDAPFLKGIIQSFDEKITDEVFYDTWGVTALPAGLDGKSYTVGGSDHYTAVFAASQHKAEAAQFLEFLANSDVGLNDYVIPMGFLPVTSSAVDRFPDSFNNPITKAFMDEVVSTSIAQPFGADYTKAASVLSISMQEVITTTKPIAEILDKTQVKLEGIIEGK
ncbi:MAG: ABC transporter substrate-binding protein [Peptococcaceae bacterium]